MTDLSTRPHDDDKFHEECGVFGVWNATDAAALTALGLHALQHRGQEASGVVALTLAQFSLLLAVVRRRPSVVRLLLATVVTGTALAGLVIAAILGWSPGETAARLIGVVAILDVLGTVVTMALGVFGGRAETPSTVTVSPALAERLP